VDRIGVRLIDFNRYHLLLPEEYPGRITVRAQFLALARVSANA
jgi:hypothetical protein